MYKPTFNMKRQRLVFRRFGNKGYSLFSCLGREVICSVLSVSTLNWIAAILRRRQYKVLTICLSTPSAWM